MENRTRKFIKTQNERRTWNGAILCSTRYVGFQIDAWLYQLSANQIDPFSDKEEFKLLQDVFYFCQLETQARFQNDARGITLSANQRTRTSLKTHIRESKLIPLGK